MKTNFQLIIFGIIYLFFFQNGFSQSKIPTPYFYDIPNSSHSLKLKEKGDFSFSAGRIRNKFGTGYSNSSANSFTNKYQKESINFQIGYSILIGKTILTILVFLKTFIRLILKRKVL